MNPRRAGARRRHILGAVLLAAVTTGLGTACHDGGGDDTPATTTGTVNFTGSGTARLELGGEVAAFTIACESTGVGGQGTLLISGAGPADTTAVGSPVGLQVQLDVATGIAQVGANLGGDPPVVVAAKDVEVSSNDGVLSASASFTNTTTAQSAGEGTLTVEGCTPG